MKTQDRNHQIRVESDINIHLENKKVSMHFFWFIWMLYVIVSMTKNCFSAAMADIVAQGYMLKSETELITSLFYVVYAPMQIVGGIACDRFSPEKLLKIGLIGAGVANTVIFFFNTSYPVMLVTWILNAVAQFAIWPAIFKIVSSQCVRSERPKMLFLISMSFHVGVFFSYGVGAVVTDWRMNFSISAVALFGLAIALHLYDRHLNKYMKWDKDAPAKATVDSDSCQVKEISTIKLFWSSGFILLLFCVMMRDSFNSVIKRIAATMLDETFGVGPSIGTLMSMLIAGSTVIGVFVAHAAISHGIVRNYVKGTIIGLFACTVLAVLFIFAPNVATNVILMCLMAGITSAITLFSTFISSYFVKYGKNATAAGVSNCAGACGFAAPLLAVIIEENSNWTVVKIFTLAIAVLGVLFTAAALPIYNRWRRREDEEERLEAEKTAEQANN